MGRRRPAAIAILVVLVAGCASDGESPGVASTATSIVVDSFPAADATIKPPPEGASNAVLDGSGVPARLTLTSWGSAGCVRVPESVRWTDPSVVEVITAPSPSRQCAASYEPISQVVELPTGYAVEEVSTVEVDGESVPFALVGER